MTKWQATFLGLKHLPRDLSGFEIEAFFTFTLAERQLIGVPLIYVPKVPVLGARRYGQKCMAHG
jgi:hypothetical protein